MGSRKRLSAEKLKEENKSKVGAKLKNCQTSPRKMRLMADLVRGVEVNKALGILRYSKKHPSQTLERLLKSAISNWEIANDGNKRDLEDGNVFIKTIFVDSARMLKRISPAPQGRAYRVRKRSNHITIVLDSLVVRENVENAVDDDTQTALLQDVANVETKTEKE